MKPLHSLRGLSAQLLLFIVLPLFLALSALASGSVLAHQRSMRALVDERDLGAVRVAAAALSADVNLQNPQSVHALLYPLQAEPGALVMLVDAKQRVIYATKPIEAGQIISHTGVAEALTGGTGLLYHRDQPGGQEHVVAYAPVPIHSASDGYTNWALVIQEPWGEVLSPWMRTSLLGPLILIPAVAAAQVRTYQQSMRGCLGAVTSAQEDKRRRLARELHDETIQDLIALKQRVQMARRKAAHDPGALDGRLADLQEMLDTTTEEVRRFSRALRPIYLKEAGLVAALEALTRDAGQEGTEVTFEVRGDVQRLGPDAELALYRIVQEALHNVARHAQASTVRVGAEFQNGVMICVQDDGVGFAVPKRVGALAETGHYGLMALVTSYSIGRMSNLPSSHLSLCTLRRK